jgi:CheY-like chemotaxis protein
VSSGQKRILVADDDSDTILVLKDRLESFGFQVTAVSNGREAVEEIMRGGYVLTVMDVMMPEMGGLDALRLIRRIQPSIPVIMISSIEENAAVSIAEGARACLLKPIDLERLREIVERCVMEAT